MLSLLKSKMERVVSVSSYGVWQIMWSKKKGHHRCWALMGRVLTPRSTTRRTITTGAEAAARVTI
jgi:hypothetical protein